MILVINEMGEAWTQPELTADIIDAVNEGVADVFDLSTKPIKRLLSGNQSEDVIDI